MKFRVHLDETFIRSELRFGVVCIDNEDRWARGPIPQAQPNRWNALLDTLGQTKRPAIVYAMRRKDCDELADLLTETLDFPCLAYHAGLDTTERSTREHAFLNGAVDLIVATSAFGMGVDKEDVRTVIHWQTPPTPEALYQEAGRAGRGEAGRPARHILLFHERDLDDAFWTIRRQIPNPDDLRRLDVAVRELADHAGGTTIVTTDAELLQLAGIRPDVECRVALAHLERVGLVREFERLSGVLGVELMNPDAAASVLESAIIDRLSVGSVVNVDPTEIADAVPGTSSASVWAALRGLERRGVVRTDDRISIRLTSAPKAAVDRVKYLRWIARELVQEVKQHAQQFGDNRYLRNPGQYLGDVDAVANSIEILAVLGYVTTRQSGGQLPHPDIRRAPKANTDRLQSAFAVAQELAQHVSNTSQLLGVRSLSSALAASPDVVRDAAVLLHLCGVASVDPRAWQGQQARRILVNAVANRDELLDEAVEQLANRAREQRLRLEALRRYAAIETELDDTHRNEEFTELDRDDVDVHQAYLERYLTEPDFLEQISAETAEDLLAGLTEQQRDIATAPADKDLVVLAGPGTGKTRTVVRRIAYRVRSHRVLAERTLAVTFTRSATEEVRARLAQLAIRGVRVQTLHSVAVRTTMSHWRALGFREEPAIAETVQQHAILRQLGSLNTRSDLAKINLAKSRLQPLGVDGGPQAINLNQLYAAYNKALGDQNLVDFGDCLILAARVFRSDAGRSLRGQYDDILVDEFQDLSPAQVDLIEAITNRSSDTDRLHLTVVGDPRQAIFEWNGADPTSLVEWYKHGKVNSQTLSLNHRSAPEILELANATISKVLPELPHVEAALSTRGTVDRHQAVSEQEMLNAVTEQVKTWQHQGIPDAEIAILAFRGNTVQDVARYLSDSGVSSHVEGLTKISETDAYDAARHAWSEIDRDQIPDNTLPSEVLDRLVETRLDMAERPDDFIEDWERLRSAVDEKSAAYADLGACLQAIRTSDEGPDDTSGVTVTTLHKSKGLEWDAVAVTDLGQNTFNKGDEGCRLLYVGMTRARQHLHLSWHGLPTQWLP